MRYVPPDRDNKEIPCKGRHFAQWALRQPNPRIIKADFVGEWAVTTVFVGHDDDGNWPPRFYPNVTCHFETEESALRWHQFVIAAVLHGDAEVTEFPHQS
jgi:hypothetical protein